MTTDIIIGGGLAALAFAAALAWFSYRAGQSHASVSNAQDATHAANTQTAKAEAMAQAQADAPDTEAAVLDRLTKGDA